MPSAARSLAIRTDGLTKRFSRRRPPVVADVDLEVGTGDVYGLLGPNGAGKSTTLRMLLGLVRPSAGSVSVLDAGPGEALRDVGALIEGPAFYPHLSGRRNLELLADLADAAGDVDEVLARVHLTDAADQPVGGYSTGMRARLGLASVLHKEPEVLVLDEPSAGLDPEGVVEVRDLLRDAGDAGRTILVSSHLLSEIELICDRVGVLSEGRLVFQGSLDELRGHATTRLTIVADPPARAADALEGAGASDVEIDDGRILASLPDDDVPAAVRHLVEADVAVHRVGEHRRSLENAYLELTRT